MTPLKTAAIGAAAVHMACADLLIAGHTAFIAAEGHHYDVVLDLAGRLLRVQVKGTIGPRCRPHRPGTPPLYIFTTDRAHHPQRDQSKRLLRYNDTEIDIIACVALDLRVTAFFPVEGPFVGGLCLYPPGTPPWIRKGVNQRRCIDQFGAETLINRISWKRHA